MMVGGFENQGDRTRHLLEFISIISHTPWNILITWMCHREYLMYFETSSHYESNVPLHVSTHCPLCYKFWVFYMCCCHQLSSCTIGNSSHELILIQFSFCATVKFPTHKTDTLSHHGNPSKHKIVPTKNPKLQA
jgi:hypothetical protein